MEILSLSKLIKRKRFTKGVCQALFAVSSFCKVLLPLFTSLIHIELQRKRLFCTAVSFSLSLFRFLTFKLSQFKVLRSSHVRKATFPFSNDVRVFETESV